MSHNDWVLPVRRTATKKTASAGVIWNTGFVGYEQSLFGHVTCATYSHKGSFMGATATGHTMLLRVPQADGNVWNDQTARVCYSMRFRPDDKLVVQSVDQRVVVRSTETNFERFVAGHTRAVRDAHFLSNQTLVSGSDDNTVRLWDLIAQKEISQGGAHTDYVRTIATKGDGGFFSGSYDHSVLFWDARNGLGDRPAASFQVGAPVEKCIFLEGRGWLATAAGDVVSFFDTRKASAPIFTAAHHVKAVTSLAYSPQHATVLTGGLDHRVCFVSVANGHAEDAAAVRKHESPVTALSVHPSGSEFVVGFQSGLVQVTKLDLKERSAADAIEESIAGASGEAAGVLGDASKAKTHEGRQEIVVHKFLLAIRINLTHFRYQRALRTALLSRIDDVITTTLTELQRRGTLRVAVANQNDRAVVSLLRFATKLMLRPSLCDLGTIVCDVALEIYAPCAATSPFLHKEITRCHKRVEAMLSSLRSIQTSLGVMDLIVAREEAPRIERRVPAHDDNAPGNPQRRNASRGN